MRSVAGLFLLPVLIVAGGSNPPDATIGPAAAKNPSRGALPDISKWQLAYLDDSTNNLYLSHGDGSHKQLIAEKADLPTWSPDGMKLAYFQGPKVFIRDMKSGKSRCVFTSKKIEDWHTDIRQMTFDPRLPLLAIPDGDGIRLVSINGAGDGFYRGKWRRGEVTAADWSPSGSKLLFTSQGDIWLGTPDLEKGSEMHLRDYGPDYLEAIRLAPIAEFNDTLGNSASTPCWADGFAWFPDEKRFLFHFQRQHGSGVSEVGIVELPTKKDWASDSHEAINGFGIKVSWLNLHGMAFGPAVCPDGHTISVSKHPPRNVDSDGGYELELLDLHGKVLKRLMPNVHDAVWRPGVR